MDGGLKLPQDAEVTLTPITGGSIAIIARCTKTRTDVWTPNDTLTLAERVAKVLEAFKNER